jgi:hypothetical protein
LPGLIKPGNHTFFHAENTVLPTLAGKIGL